MRHASNTCPASCQIRLSTKYRWRQLATYHQGVRQAKTKAGAAFLIGRITLAALVPLPARAQNPLTVSGAVRLATVNAPDVNRGTQVAFAYDESHLRPWTIQDNTSARSYFQFLLADAVALAGSLLDQSQSLVLGIMQANSVNMARTELTVTSASNATASMRAGSVSLVAAYRQYLHGGSGENLAVATVFRFLHGCASDRLVWESDWPRTDYERLGSLDAARRALDFWVPAKSDRRATLVVTLRILFRFGAEAGEDPCGSILQPAYPTSERDA
jgi:hypothetical protein